MGKLNFPHFPCANFAVITEDGNPLIRIIAEKQMGTHTYRVYLDYRYGSINRQILMCTKKKLDNNGMLAVTIDEFEDLCD